jgi:very-short-patch-repair endonuclease
MKAHTRYGYCRTKQDLFLSHWAHLYTDITEPEAALEPAIAALGKRYRAQHPVFAVRAIADFALLDDKVIIEVDGKSHASKKAKEKDRERTLRLEKYGWVVVRCSNEEALKDPHSTVARLISEARDRREALGMLNYLAKRNSNGYANDGRSSGERNDFGSDSDAGGDCATDEE